MTACASFCSFFSDSRPTILHTRGSHHLPSYTKSIASTQPIQYILYFAAMSSDSNTTTGSATSWEAVAFLRQFPDAALLINPQERLLHITPTMEPWVLTRKLTDPPSEWNASDDPFAGSAAHHSRKLFSWREQWGSKLSSALPEVGSEITSDQMRDDWFDVLEEALKSETGSNGIFKDQTVTLKLVGPEQTSSGRTVSGTQGLFEAATRSTKVKTFSRGVEAQPSEGTTEM